MSYFCNDDAAFRPPEAHGPAVLTNLIPYYMLRKVRTVLAVVFFAAVTLLFLDFTGTAHAWLGWTARIQFLPALLALNVGVVLGLVVLTLVFGRVYCSVICPLGVFQDVVAWFARRRRRLRYKYSPAPTWLRRAVLVVFVVALVAGFGSAAALLAPYSSYGRIASSFFAPVYAWGNNVLAYFAERMDSYAFYSTDVWLRSLPTFIVAAATLIVLVVLAWRGGRTYCNTICPVGTVLGFLARFSWFKPVIDTDKCIGCKRCARSCKASCIDVKRHAIDYSRCVACMDCLDNCSEGAIRYIHPRRRAPQKAAAGPAPAAPDAARRGFLTAAGLLASGLALRAQRKKVDGGLAVIEEKKVPRRGVPLVPAGAMSLRHFTQHCTACQLCVSVCPNGVLRPSADTGRLMQPEMSYERGYCRPECTKCGDVCPAGAIRPFTAADKSATQIGHAVWDRTNCVVLTDGVACGNCARHCPTGAITMVPSVPGNAASPKIPAVNVGRCIGCGACENLCPARPFSAIRVEGHEVHSEI